MRQVPGIQECLRRMGQLCVLGVLLTLILLLASCDPAKQPQADYVPITQLEQSFGPLITVANLPTPNQNGTGDRLGLFGDLNGTVWGIPLTIAENGNVLGCAPPMLREVPVSDTLPADAVEIVGAANEPNGWREGTGKLELLLRDAQGGLRWHSVSAVEVKSGAVCWSQSPPEQLLKFYRIIKEDAAK